MASTDQSKRSIATYAQTVGYTHDDSVAKKNTGNSDRTPLARVSCINVPTALARDHENVRRRFSGKDSRTSQ